MECTHGGHHHHHDDDGHQSHHHEHVHSAECGCINVHESDLCGRGLCNHIEHMRMAREAANDLENLAHGMFEDKEYDVSGRSKKKSKRKKDPKYKQAAEKRSKEEHNVTMATILLNNFDRKKQLA